MLKTKILLANLRDYIIEEEDFCGMCVSNAKMVDDKIIKQKEMEFIHGYIHENTPKRFRFKGYWWKFGSKKPRINWLNKQIQKLDE